MRFVLAGPSCSSGWMASLSACSAGSKDCRAGMLGRQEQAMVVAIEAQRCDLPVPDRWLSFPGKKQNGNNNDCAVLCVAAAAVHFGLVYEAMPPSALLAGVRPPSARRAISRRRHNPGMLLPQDLEMLALAGGMKLCSPTPQCIQQFLHEGQLWIALVRQRFVNPIARSCAFRDNVTRKDTARSSVVRNQYLLVLDYLRRAEALVVFDPHPWNRSVYCIGLEMFERGWRAAHRMQFPWAGRLLPEPKLIHC